MRQFPRSSRSSCESRSGSFDDGDEGTSPNCVVAASDEDGAAEDANAIDAIIDLMVQNATEPILVDSLSVVFHWRRNKCEYARPKRMLFCHHKTLLLAHFDLYELSRSGSGRRPWFAPPNRRKRNKKRGYQYNLALIDTTLPGESAEQWIVRKQSRRILGKSC